MSRVPDIRVRPLNVQPVSSDGAFVLYWMTAQRRLQHNFALQRAVEWSRSLNRPLLILEALRCDYRWASLRHHAFIIQGMKANQEIAKRHMACYYPWVEPSPGAGHGLMAELSRRSCVVVADDYPCFFLPQMHQAVARRLPVLLEAVDSNGLLPMAAADQVFPTAYAFRRFLQKTLRTHLAVTPDVSPLSNLNLSLRAEVPRDIADCWPPASEALLNLDSAAVRGLPVSADPGLGAASGGAEAAARQLQAFLSHRLSRYADERNQPDEDVASGLSPWLHFGHLSVHQVFHDVAVLEDWSPDRLGDVRQTRGAREGWWGMSKPAEAFLDELVTWRELGFNMCARNPHYDQYESLPHWAQETLAAHASDVRPVIYSQDELSAAATHDRLWNAAQNQLLQEGRMHNYLRMLWGKKILEWSPDPQAALQIMIELNNRYALDGRDPNSYSGIFWVLGRYDRAWGPERPIFGKVRYMTSENTARKLSLTQYLDRYAPDRRSGRLFS